MSRFNGHAQVLLHLRHNAFHMPVGVNDLNILQFFLTVIHGIFNTQFNEFTLFTYLRNGECAALNRQIDRV